MAADPIWVVGFHAVEAALSSDRSVEVLWLVEGRGDGRIRRLLDLARERGIQVRTVRRARLDEVAGGVAHNGCAVRVAPVAWHNPEDLLRSEGEPGRLLLVDSPSDPHNVGAVLRSAAAFGIDGVILAGPSLPPLGGAVAKAAAGALEQVPVARGNVAADVAMMARDAGYWVFGAAAEGTSVREVRLDERWLLCVGAEAKGLRAKTRRFVDELIAIPMAPGTQSLNLSVAAGVLLYELCTRPGGV